MTIEHETVAVVVNGLASIKAGALEHLVEVVSAVGVTLLLAFIDRSGKWWDMPAHTFGERLRQIGGVVGRTFARAWKRDGRPVLPRTIAAAADAEHRDVLIDLNREITRLQDELAEARRQLADREAVPREPQAPSGTRAMLAQQAGELAEMRGLLKRLADAAVLNDHPVDASKAQAMKDAIAKADDARRMLDEAQREMRAAAGLPAEETPDPPVEAQPEQSTLAASPPPSVQDGTVPGSGFGGGKFGEG